MRPTTPVLIVEPSGDGHRLGYVALLLDELATRGSSATVLTSRAAVQSAEWAIHIAQLSHSFGVVLAEDFSLHGIATASDEIRASRVIVPDGDRLLPRLAVAGWRGSGTLVVLMMRPEPQPGRSAAGMFAVKYVKRALLRTANRRKQVAAFALTSPLSPASGVTWVADPVALETAPHLVEQFTAELASHSATYWVGVFGYVSTRKNLHLLADAITPLQGVGLVLAGTISEDAEELARPWLESLRANGRLALYPGPLASDVFDSLLSSVDCVVAAHSNDGPSGVVARAAVAGKVLVLAGAPTLSRDADALGAQAYWAELSALGLRNAIATVKCELRRFSPPAGGVEQFVNTLLGPSS